MSHPFRRAQPVASGTNALLIVADDTSLTAADNEWKDWLDAHDDVSSVQVNDDGDTEEDTTDGHDVVIISTTASVGTTAYRGDGTNPIPWIDSAFATLDDRERTGGVQEDRWGTTIRYADATEISWTGETVDTDIALISAGATKTFWSTIPTDGLAMIFDTSAEINEGLWTFEAGDTMDGSIDTDVRGIAFPVGRWMAVATWNSSGTQLQDDMLEWVTG